MQESSITGTSGAGHNFPPANPTFLQKFVSYLLVVGAIFPTMLFFMHVLNRTRVLGRRNLRKIEPPFILMSNHVSLLDDLFLDPVMFYPRAIYGYKYFPYHAPEERNFYKTPFIAWFMRNTKSIPLVRGKGPKQEGMTRMIEAVKNGGFLHIYPEGTRTRNGDMGEGKAGIGRLVYEAGVPIVPMYHQGMERILPIGSGIPRIGRQVRLSIGEPIYFDEELRMSNSPATWKLITQKIMAGIHKQKELLEEKFGTHVYKISRFNSESAHVRVRVKSIKPDTN